MEIYNDSDLEVNLGDFIFIADSYVNQLPNGVLLAPQNYAVLARQLIPEDGSDSFEGHWGDSSGVWGDDVSEDYIAIDVAMILNNSSGNIRIENEFGLVLDEFSWDSPSDDGRSVERNDIHDIDSGWHYCFDPDGSTPGRENSPIPPEGEYSFQVEIDPVVLSVGNGESDDFKIRVVVPHASKLSVRVYDETGFKVKSLAENTEATAQEYFWDGKNDQGVYLSPGVYIISFDLSGLSNNSKYYPVVIAP